MSLAVKGLQVPSLHGEQILFDEPFKRLSGWESSSRTGCAQGLVVHVISMAVILGDTVVVVLELGVLR
jgi:hypothetical protein